jgi:hypothetical protein
MCRAAVGILPTESVTLTIPFQRSGGFQRIVQAAEICREQDYVAKQDIAPWSPFFDQHF